MPETALLASCLVLVYVVLAARLTLGSWYAPAAFFSAIWSVQVFLSFFVKDYPISSTAIWWIVLTCSMLLVGNAIGRAVAGKPPETDEDFAFWRPELVLIATSVFGGFYMLVIERGGIDIAVQNPPKLYQILLSFQFAGPFLGGMMFAGKIRRRRLALLPLLPPAVLAMVYTGRTAILGPVVFWLGGYLAFRFLPSTGRAPQARPRVVVGGVLLLAAFTVLGVVLQMFRDTYVAGLTPRERIDTYVQVSSWDAFGESWDKFVRPSVLGQVYSFSTFLAQAQLVEAKPKLGAVIFAGPLDLVGRQGERYPFESFEIEEGILSNVFTMFSVPIADFGLIGSHVWWLIIGLVQGVAFQRVRRGGVLACVLLGWFYVDTALIGGFFFRYNSVILAYVLAAGYLVVAKHWKDAPEIQRPTAVVVSA